MVAHYFSPEPILLHIVVNNTVFIACNCSFQKWVGFLAIEQNTKDGNAVHFP